MNNKLNKTSENKPKRDEKGRLLPGYTANPDGRPKRGWSIKDKFWKRFENNPTELKTFLDKLLKEHPGLVWQMLEGKPAQPLEVGTKEDLPFVIKIIKGEENGKDSQDVSETV